jgi:capsular exopolysaccharide synthesis family protein
MANLPTPVSGPTSDSTRYSASVPEATVIGAGTEAQDFSLRQIWGTLTRNRLLVAVCLMVTPILSGALALLVTPVYEATLSVRIDEKRSGLPVLEALNQLSDQGGELNTEMEVLRSRSLAEATVDSLALQVSATTPLNIFGGRFGPSRTRPRSRDEFLSQVTASRTTPSARYVLRRRPDSRYDVIDRASDKRVGLATPGSTYSGEQLQFALSPSALEHEVIYVDVAPYTNTVRRVRSRLDIRRPQRDANFVTVRYQSPDPHLTSEVPNTLAARFLAERNKIIKTEARSTVAFLREQLDTLSKQLATTEDALRAFREGNRVVSLPAEASVRVSELTRLQAERGAKEAEREALQRALDNARQNSQATGASASSAYRSLIAFPTLIGTSASQFLQALNEAENQRALLLQRRTASDRDVQVLTARIRELEEQLSNNVQTYLSGLSSQLASMDASLAKFNEQLARIPSKEMQFVRLERQNKVLADIYTLLQTRLQEAQIAQAVEDSRVRVVDPAIPPRQPIKPNKKQFVLLGVIVGLMIGAGLSIVREALDRTVHTREDMTQLTGMQSLGLVPHIQRAGAGDSIRFAPKAASPRGVPTQVSSRVVTVNSPMNPVTEAYRTLRTNITFAKLGEPLKVLVLTSPTPGDGKSTTAANLAATLGFQGLRVILLDADMRRGTLHHVFNVAKEPGLSNALIGTHSLDDCIQSISLGEFGTLDVVPPGVFPPNPSELLSSQRIGELLAELERRYDVVIFDTPPVNLVTDAAILGARAGGVVLIARAGKTDKGALAYAAEQLRNVRAPVLGTVLNDFDFRRDVRYAGYGTPGYYYYASYGYGYRYGYSAYGATEDASSNGSRRKLAKRRESNV